MSEHILINENQQNINQLTAIELPSGYTQQDTVIMEQSNIIIPDSNMSVPLITPITPIDQDSSQIYEEKQGNMCCICLTLMFYYIGQGIAWIFKTLYYSIICFCGLCCGQ
ncbi:Hypothetical_protein [Hexamita inflata]|uniref:Hypothetical_protein n=1 Tax=Hexamita inflata TaxID=28002 RepID=A0AA86PXB5_9EUKA|nr:Hypothetical protein HINF_LOCUS33113 [Hexamita inflata]